MSGTKTVVSVGVLFLVLVKIVESKDVIKKSSVL